MFVTIEAFKHQDIELFLNTHLLTDITNKMNYETHLIDQLKNHSENNKTFFNKGGIFNIDKFYKDTMESLIEERDDIINNIGVEMSYCSHTFDRIQKRHLKEPYDTTSLKETIKGLDVIDVIKKSIKENYKNTYICFDDLDHEKLFCKLTGYSQWSNINNKEIAKVLVVKRFMGYTYDSDKSHDYEASLRNLIIMAITL